MRKVKLTMDYLTGMPVKDLAEREKVSYQRIYQLLDKMAGSLTGTYCVKYADKDQLMRRLKELAQPALRHVEVAATPEEFYTEMTNEPRTRNFS